MSVTGISTFAKELSNEKTTGILPAVFIGHGSPMNALADNDFTKALKKAADGMERPKAILVISAHWLTNGSFVASTKLPETIYDFGGFPDALYKVKYPAPGSPDFAQMVKDEVHNVQIKLDHDMGLDHGAWTVLKHMYPAADIPVFELSIDYTKPASYHYNLALELAKLREKGLLIIGSGNIVHNLRRLNWDEANAKPFDWSLEFDTKVKSHLINHEHKPLIEYEKMGEAALLSVPTNDHYLPMIYAIALQQKKEEVKFIYESIDMGSISMRSFLIS